MPRLRRPRGHQAARRGPAGEHSRGASTCLAASQLNAGPSSSRPVHRSILQALLVGLRPDAISLAASVGVEWWVNQTEMAWSGACTPAHSLCSDDLLSSAPLADRLTKEQDAHASRDARLKAKLTEVHEAFKKAREPRPWRPGRPPRPCSATPLGQTGDPLQFPTYRPHVSSLTKRAGQGQISVPAAGIGGAEAARCACGWNDAMLCASRF